MENKTRQDALERVNAARHESLVGCTPEYKVALLEYVREWADQLELAFDNRPIGKWTKKAKPCKSK